MACCPLAFSVSSVRVISSRLCSRLAEHDSGHLGAEPGGVVLGRQQRLEALDALGRVEELLVGLDDLVDALAGEAEVLRDEGGAVGGEDPVGKLQVEQPVPDARRHLTRAVDEELARRLVVQQPVLDAVLVVGDADRLHARQVETVEVGGVLALRVVPEHDPVARRTSAPGADGPWRRHSSLASRPGIFFSAAPNFG